MDLKMARRDLERSERSVFKRLGKFVNNGVCSYWLAGKCNRNPCRFLHTELPSTQTKQTAERPYFKSRSTWRNPNYYNPKNGIHHSSKGAESEVKNGQETTKKIGITQGARSGDECSVKTQPKLCQYWVTGNCVYGDQCKDVHSWSIGNGFSMLAKLQGHSKAITGVALPSGSDKLFSGSRDKSVQVWDCHSGQSVGAVAIDGEVGCLTSEGPWMFVGFPNAIKAWNFQTQKEHTANGPVGQVHAMVVGNDLLFAGTEDGTIFAWRCNSETNSIELVASLKGHTDAVLSLVVGANRLYSGSRDNTIRVWSLDSLECLHTLNGHADTVTSVLCWDNYLLSGSLDKTIKVWAATEIGNLEVIYELKEESGVLALSGIHDAEAKPILLCSRDDNSVRLYDLPSFHERGRIFTKREVRSIQIGSDGLFFTGDATGELFVWRLCSNPIAATS